MNGGTEAVLKHAISDSVLLLTMNRPEKRNALNLALVEALAEALREADDVDDIHVVVLTGAGKAFCAGADMREFPDPASRDRADSERRSDLMNHLFGTIPRMTKPVLAAVNGFALGGGCALMLGCDFAFAAEGSSFGYPELRHGMVAGGVMPSLVRLVGTRAAFDLVGTGRTVDASEALGLGLVNRVVPPESLLDEALSFATQLASYPPAALATTKRLLHESATLSLVDGLARARALRRN